MNRGQLIGMLDDLLAEVALIDTATPGDAHKANVVQTIRGIKAELAARKPRGKSGEAETETEIAVEEASEAEEI